MNLKKTISSVLVAVLLSLSALFAVTAPAQAAGANYERCSGGTTFYDWSGKNPKDCKSGVYLMVRDGKEVLKMKTDRPWWEGMQEGYEAAQKWCSENTLTCNILTSVGIAAVMPLLAPANS